MAGHRHPALSAYVYEGRGEAERFLGRPDLAAPHFRRCIALAAGRIDEARAEFEQVAEMYERKGIVPWARRVHRALEGLGHPSP